MTERKPPSMSYTSWIDQQIMEAEKRGVFDNLPGMGKPLPERTEADSGQAWLRDYLRREGVPTEELLPTPLRLRKEAERLAAGVRHLRSEQDVRDAVQELNRRIMKWRQAPTGSPIFVPLVNEEQLAAAWRAGRSAAPPAAAPPAATPPAATPAGTGPHPRDSAASPPAGSAPARPRWWRRRGRPGRI